MYTTKYLNNCILRRNTVITKTFYNHKLEQCHLEDIQVVSFHIKSIKNDFILDI